MRSFGVPLWAAGIATWPLVIAVMWRDDATTRSVAWSIILAGAISLPMMAIDYAQRRRVWLAVLMVTTAVAWFLQAMGLAGSDDQAGATMFYSWFMVVPLGLLLTVVTAVVERWIHRKRRWSLEFEGSDALFVRKR